MPRWFLLKVTPRLDIRSLRYPTLHAAMTYGLNTLYSSMHSKMLPLMYATRVTSTAYLPRIPGHRGRCETCRLCSEEHEGMSTKLSREGSCRLHVTSELHINYVCDMTDAERTTNSLVDQPNELVECNKVRQERVVVG